MAASVPLKLSAPRATFRPPAAPQPPVAAKRARGAAALFDDVFGTPIGAAGVLSELHGCMSSHFSALFVGEAEVTKEGRALLQRTQQAVPFIENALQGFYLAKIYTGLKCSLFGEAPSASEVADIVRAVINDTSSGVPWADNLKSALLDFISVLEKAKQSTPPSWLVCAFIASLYIGGKAPTAEEEQPQRGKKTIAATIRT